MFRIFYDFRLLNFYMEWSADIIGIRGGATTIGGWLTDPPSSNDYTQHYTILTRN